MVEATSSTLAKARLRHHLEVQSLIIEETMSEYYRRPLRVSGGNVQANRIWYELLLEKACIPTRAIEYDLQQKLGVRAKLSFDQGRLRVAVDRPSPPVDLLNLMQQYGVPGPGGETAVLGLDSVGRPVQLDLSQSGHVLVAGGAASGKTALLGTTAVSLALANHPNQLQLLIIQTQPGGDAVGLNNLSPGYLLRPVISTAAQATQALLTLANNLERMPVLVSNGARLGPRVVVMIDQIETLLAAAGFALLEPLVRLLGTTGSLTLFVSTQNPQNDLLRYCGDRWGTRIVGRVADADEAEVAAGLPHSRAEQLLGDGAFLLFRQGMSEGHYFQAAYADRYDLSFLTWQQSSQPIPSVPFPV